MMKTPGPPFTACGEARRVPWPPSECGGGKPERQSARQGGPGRGQRPAFGGRAAQKPLRPALHSSVGGVSEARALLKGATVFCPQGHRGVCDRLSMRVPAYFIDDITRAQSRSRALKFQGGKYVLWEKANAENCGLVLDRAEIISPSHTPRRLTVNENIHLAGACLGVWKRRNKMRKERAVLPHPLATYLLPLRGDSKSRRANPAESGQPGLWKIPL